MIHRRRRLAATALLGVLTMTAAGCSGGADTDDGSVTLSVVSLLPGSDEAAFEAFDALVAQFEEAHPGIDVEPVEYEWRATTFASDLAGGTLPDVFEVPFTDALTLIENEQIADMDAEFRSLPYADDFNPAILEAGTGADGHVYAIPAKNVYGVGLHYNRALFESAGLDPDSPPTTWDEVRADAAAIAEANPGVAGYMQMSQEGTGGWQLVVNAFARGASVQTIESDGTATSTLDDPGVVEALEWLHDLRWEDDSLGSNFLLDWSTMNQAFAAGEVAMFTSGSDVYTSMVQSNGIDPDTYGLTALPLDGDDAGVLTGGTLAAVPAGTDAATREAAIEWIDFFYLHKLVDEDAAVQDAETLVASDQPVGTPVLPMFSPEQYEQSQEWIADYVNVPLEHMTGYTDTMFELPLIGEPSQQTQPIYQLLDPVVQAVLTDEHADIPALLADANQQAQALLDAA